MSKFVFVLFIYVCGSLGGNNCCLSRKIFKIIGCLDFKKAINSKKDEIRSWRPRIMDGSRCR